MTNGLDRLSSLETFAISVGQSVETAELEWDEIPADQTLAERLAIPVGHSVLVVKRVKLIASARVGWMLDYVPEGAVPFDAVRAEFNGSLLDVLLSHPEAGIEYADAQITPVNLSTAIAQRLLVKRGETALFVDAVACTADGRPVELALAWLLPAYFRFSVRRRPSLGPHPGRSRY